MKQPLIIFITGNNPSHKVLSGICQIRVPDPGVFSASVQWNVKFNSSTDFTVIADSTVSDKNETVKLAE